jgi:hypothetical protein
LGGRDRQISEFEVILVYIVNSRMARATQRKTVSKKKKKKKKKRKKERKKKKKELKFTSLNHIEAVLLIPRAKFYYVATFSSWIEIYYIFLSIIKDKIFDS